MIGDRWGVTDAEVARAYPCDELVPAPAVQLWRGITVAAAPAAVWPWLCQVQLAPYSYDWVDNLGRRSPRRLIGHPDPTAGEHFSSSGGRFRFGQILSVTHGEQLTARIMGALMSYVLVPEGPSTRLLLKIVLAEKRWWSAGLAVGDWPMARKQLLTLKACAESGQVAPHAPQ